MLKPTVSSEPWPDVTRKYAAKTSLDTPGSNSCKFTRTLDKLRSLCSTLPRPNVTYIFFFLSPLQPLHHSCLSRHCHGHKLLCLVHDYSPIYGTMYYSLSWLSPFVHTSKGHTSYSGRTSILTPPPTSPYSRCCHSHTPSYGYMYTSLPRHSLSCLHSSWHSLVYQLAYAHSCPLASSMHNLYSNLVSFPWTCCMTKA